MCSCFQHAYNKEKINSPKGQVWLDMLTQIHDIYPDEIPFKPPTRGIRYFCYKLYKHSFFAMFIYSIILVNLITMTLPYEDSQEIYVLILDKISLICIIIFALEAIIKIIALDFLYYFNDSWNKFDFAVVLTGIVDILIISSFQDSNIGGIFKTIQVIRVFRIIRVIRVFKLKKRMNRILKLFQSFAWSYYGIINVFLLYLITIFIFTLLGCFIYKDYGYLKYKNYFVAITDHYNFDNFYQAYVLLLISMNDNFETFMFEYMNVEKQFAHQFITVIFFWIYYFFCFIIMFNVFLCVIIMQYDEFYAKKENPIEKFKKISDFFRLYWSENIETDGTLMRMRSINIKKFLERFENHKPDEDFLPKKELYVNSSLLYIFEISLLE